MVKNYLLKFVSDGIENITSIPRNSYFHFSNYNSLETKAWNIWNHFSVADNRPLQAVATIATDIPSSIPLMNPITQDELEPFLDKPRSP